MFETGARSGANAVRFGTECLVEADRVAFGSQAADRAVFQHLLPFARRPPVGQLRSAGYLQFATRQQIAPVGTSYVQTGLNLRRAMAAVVARVIRLLCVVRLVVRAPLLNHLAEAEHPLLLVVLVERNQRDAVGIRIHFEYVLRAQAVA